MPTVLAVPRSPALLSLCGCCCSHFIVAELKAEGAEDHPERADVDDAMAGLVEEVERPPDVAAVRVRQAQHWVEWGQTVPVGVPAVADVSCREKNFHASRAREKNTHSTIREKNSHPERI